MKLLPVISPHSVHESFCIVEHAAIIQLTMRRAAIVHIVLCYTFADRSFELFPTSHRALTANIATTATAEAITDVS